jgi:uncharacterized glyoxalase superfamily protein PhnB
VLDLKEGASNRPDLTKKGNSIAVEHQTEGGAQTEASWQRIAAAGTAQCVKMEEAFLKDRFPKEH